MNNHLKQDNILWLKEKTLEAMQNCQWSPFLLPLPLLFCHKKQQIQIPNPSEKYFNIHAIKLSS